MNPENTRNYVFRDYKRPALKLIFSGAALLIVIPIVIIIFILFIVSIFPTALFLGLFLATPFMLAVFSSAGSLLLAQGLSRIYNNWYVKNTFLLAFLVILTDIAFIYGAYYTFFDSDTFSKLEEYSPTYLGISAVPVTVFIALFCALSPWLYAVYLENTEKFKVFAIFVPLALFALNTLGLNSFKDVATHAYPQDIRQTPTEDRKPSWILAPDVDLAGYSFDNCTIANTERTLDCRLISSDKELLHIEMLMTEIDASMDEYLFNKGQCDMAGLYRYIENREKKDIELEECGEIVTPNDRMMYGRKNVYTVSGNRTYVYFTQDDTITIFSAKTDRSKLDSNDIQGELGLFVDSFSNITTN